MCSAVEMGWVGWSMVAISASAWWSSGLTVLRGREGPGSGVVPLSELYSTAVRTFTVAPSSVEV